MHSRQLTLCACLKLLVRLFFIPQLYDRVLKDMLHIIRFQIDLYELRRSLVVDKFRVAHIVSESVLGVRDLSCNGG